MVRNVVSLIVLVIFVMWGLSLKFEELAANARLKGKKPMEPTKFRRYLLLLIIFSVLLIILSLSGVMFF